MAAASTPDVRSDPLSALFRASQSPNLASPVISVQIISHSGQSTTTLVSTLATVHFMPRSELPHSCIVAGDEDKALHQGSLRAHLFRLGHS